LCRFELPFSSKEKGPGDEFVEYGNIIHLCLQQTDLIPVSPFLIPITESLSGEGKSVTVNCGHR
jgi:hypothetical protein